MRPWVRPSPATRGRDQGGSDRVAPVSLEVQPERESGRPRRWPLLVLLGAIAAFYAPTLGRGFVSEDFIILRLLSEGSLVRTAFEQLTGPWLGVSFFAFYRPLGTIVLHLEWMAFGTWSLGYQLVHLGVHLVAVVLVIVFVRHSLRSVIADDRGRDLAALLAAAVFGLAPMAPNAVTFIASFATLFSTLAVLLAIGSFARWRASSGDAGAGRWPWATFGWTAVAMATYEGAVVLPALVLAVDLAAERGGKRTHDRRSRRARAIVHGMLWALAGVYLLFRGLAIGSLIGGYPDLAAAFGGDHFGDLLRRLRFDVSRLILPTWGDFHPTWLARGLDAALVVCTIVAAIRWRRPWARWWLLGLAWIFIAQLPFGTPSLVPANGRYGYLATVGVGFLAVSAVLATSSLRSIASGSIASGSFVSGSFVSGSGLAAVVAVYGTLLTISSLAHRDAGTKARDLRAALLDTVAATPAPRFVAGEPEFVRHDRGPWAGVPIAQVFHWGLADALMPPFTDRDIDVYPLPRFADEAMAPLAALGVGTLTRVTPGGDLAPLAPTAPADRALALSDAFQVGPWAYRVEGLQGDDDARVVVVAKGHPDLVPVVADPVEPSTIVRISPAFAESMRNRWGGTIYVWVEARDARGRVIAQSNAITLGQFLPADDEL